MTDSQRMTGTAFAILAMFFITRRHMHMQIFERKKVDFSYNRAPTRKMHINKGKN